MTTKITTCMNCGEPIDLTEIEDADDIPAGIPVQHLVCPDARPVMNDYRIEFMVKELGTTPEVTTEDPDDTLAERVGEPIAGFTINVSAATFSNALESMRDELGNKWVVMQENAAIVDADQP